MQQQQTSPSTSENTVDIYEFLQKILFTSDVTDADVFIQSRSLVFESPEHELYFSILEEAWWDFVNNFAREKSIQRKLFQEVFDWFFNEHRTQWSGSFEHICEMFNLDCNYIRKGIILWVKKKIVEPQSSLEAAMPKPVTKDYSKFVDISEII